RMNKMTQTAVSSRLRMIVRAMGAMVLLGEKPTLTRLASIIQRRKLEKSVPGYPDVPLSAVLYHYLNWGRNYSVTTSYFGIHRPKVRAAFRRAAPVLMADETDREAIALGDLITRVLHGASCQGGGYNKAEKKRQGDVTHRDP